MTFAIILATIILGMFVVVFMRRRQAEAASTWEMAYIPDLQFRVMFNMRYADVVRRLMATYPNLVQSPDCLVEVLIHPGPFPKPNSNYWGRVLAPDVNYPHGRLVLLESQKSNVLLQEHEIVHCVTGISDHPPHLYNGLQIKV